MSKKTPRPEIHKILFDNVAAVIASMDLYQLFGDVDDSFCGDIDLEQLMTEVQNHVVYKIERMRLP